ncbi:MAG: NHL domain-containing protein [Bacteroidia bacterium]
MKKIVTLLALAFCLYTNAQIITTVAGRDSAGYTGDGGQATAAKLDLPYDITFDAIGNMYIADEFNHCIRKVNTLGIITTIAGTGTHGFIGDGGQATAAKLDYPRGVKVDATGNLYISDSENNRIRKINTAGIITTVAGNGTAGYSGDGGQATTAGLYNPNGVAFDALGNMYIPDDYNNRVRMINTAGIITTIAGTGTATYSGDGGQASVAELNFPSGVCLDAAGNLYIADQSNNRIRKINTAGVISTFVGNGTAGSSGDMGQATVAEINAPFGVVFDASGNLYIADRSNQRIRKVNTTGIISTIAGTGTSGYTGDMGQATAAELSSPFGVTIDAAGNLYIADDFNNRIRKVANVVQAGINQVTNSNEVTIYPNPAKEIINVKLGIINSTTTLQITDMLGNTVKQFIIYNSPFQISTADLSEGIYTISISSNEGVVNKRLVIVR